MAGFQRKITQVMKTIRLSSDALDLVVRLFDPAGVYVINRSDSACRIYTVAGF